MSEEEKEPQEPKMPLPKIRLAPKPAGPRGIPLKPSLRPLGSMQTPARPEQPAPGPGPDDEEAIDIRVDEPATPAEETGKPAAGALEKPVPAPEPEPETVSPEPETVAPEPAQPEEVEPPKAESAPAKAEQPKASQASAATVQPLRPPAGLVKPKPHIAPPAPRKPAPAVARQSEGATSPVSLGIDIFTAAAALVVAFLVVNDLLKFL